MVSLPSELLAAIVEHIDEEKHLAVLARTHPVFSHIAAKKLYVQNVQKNQQLLEKNPYFLEVCALEFTTQNPRYGTVAKAAIINNRLDKTSSSHIFFEATKRNDPSILMTAKQFNVSIYHFWLLHLAVGANSYNIVSWLLQYTYFQNYLSEPIYSFLLDKACRAGSDETLYFFLENGHGFSDTPLSIARAALSSPSRSTMKILLNCGIQLTTDQTQDLLREGIHMNPTCDYILFISNGARVEVNHFEGLLRNSNTDGVAFLLDDGFSENACFGDDTTLNITARRNDLETTRLLLRYEADPNFCTPNGRRPLETSVIYGNDELVKLFLQYNANLDWQDEDYVSLIMIAIHAGKLQCLRLLLEYGKGIKQHMLLNPLLLAYEKKKWEIAHEILRYAKKQLD